MAYNSRTLASAEGKITYGYDSAGNKKTYKIVEGRTYNLDGSRIKSGSTVQTNDGIYKMTSSGGVKVTDHNTYLDNKKNYEGKTGSKEITTLKGTVFENKNNELVPTFDPLKIFNPTNIFSSNTTEKKTYEGYYEEQKGDIKIGDVNLSKAWRMNFGEDRGLASKELQEKKEIEKELSKEKESVLPDLGLDIPDLGLSKIIDEKIDFTKVGLIGAVVLIVVLIFKK